MDISTREVGQALFLFVFIYFLYRIGIRLAKDDLGDMKFWAWLFTIIAMFVGLSSLNDGSVIGFLGFIPILVYIISKIIHGTNFDCNVKKKIKMTVFSAIASPITYIITNAVFGFGIPEASLSAIISAGILGIAGYTA